MSRRCGGSVTTRASGQRVSQNLIAGARIRIFRWCPSLARVLSTALRFCGHDTRVDTRFISVLSTRNCEGNVASRTPRLIFNPSLAGPERRSLSIPAISAENERAQSRKA